MIEITQSILYILIPVLLALKLVLFYISTSHRKASHFIYYPAENIYSTTNDKKQKAKILQYNLTIAILILTAVAGVAFILFK